MEFEVMYSGSLERAGLCPSLSGYQGLSTTGAILRDLEEQPRKASPTRIPLPVDLPGYGEVKRRIRNGYSLRQTARHFQIGVSDVRRLLREAMNAGEKRERRRARTAETNVA